MMNIREARKDDADFIVQSQLSMALETEGLRLDPPTVALGVRAVLEDAHKGKYFIAETTQEPNLGTSATHSRAASIACLLTMPEWSDWRNGTVIWIHSLYVTPDHRRSGAFHAFYSHLKTLVLQSGGTYRGLRLYVDKRNEVAKKAYERVGMTAEHYELFEWLNS